MPTLPAPALEHFAAALFLSAGVPPDTAAAVARSLVAADLRGHESHGVMRVARYIERIRDGTLKPAARPSVARRHAANAVIDGAWGFGQLAAQFGAQLAIEICREHGQAGVAVSNAHHVGRLGDYAETLAAAGLAVVVLAGGGNRGGSVAPHGSRKRLLGTNPIALAVPTPAPHPLLVVDFATSELPEGKVAVARANGHAISPGCVLDREGRASVNPADFYAGGALLPFGGHKGSALVLMVEILATLLAGSVPVALRDYTIGNPTLILAWSIDAFVEREIFAARIGELLTRVRTSAPADGFSEVLVPGEIEDRTRMQREREGIPLSEGVWRELTALGESLGATAPAL